MGSVTSQIVKKLRDGDHLDAVELKKEYSDFLQSNFEFYNNVTIYNCSVLKLNPTEKYDFIVSTLPFNAFDPNDVQEILDFFVTNLKDGGWISFVEYPFTWMMKYLRSDSWGQYREVQKITKQFRDIFGCKTNRVIRNVPPLTMVHHVQVTEINRKIYLGKDI